VPPVAPPPAEENDRRIVSLVHLAFLAAIPIYALVVWFARREPLSGTPPAARFFWILAGIGLVQYLIVTWIGGRFLRAGRANARGRVRAYFLIRFAAAEAIAIYGLMLGFLGAPALRVAVLLALGMAAMATSRPSPGAWNEALRESGFEPPSVAPSP
jgi:F0F1-type ATP synthase membrane subunit c/vacuolar-type H+-ATPase subunit K